MKKIILCALIAGALAARAQIIWQTPQTITGPADVDTKGEYLGSWAPYDGNTYVGYTPNANYGPINGVNFYGYSDLDNGAGLNTAGSFDGGGGAYYSAASTANNIYNTMLAYGAYANGTSATMNWGDMTPGGLYEVEFWVEDARGASGRSETLSDGVNTSSPLEYSTLVTGHYHGSYIIGTFVADDTGSETLTLNADASAQANLFQVRTLLAATPTVSPSTNVYAGSTVTISSGVTGGTPTSFLWQSNGVNIATSSNITFTATDPSSTLPLNDIFTVTVVNSYGSMTSAQVALTINPAAAATTVTNEPPPVTPLFQGDSVTLSYAVGGTPPIWVQWEQNGMPIGTFTNVGQATTVSLTLSGLQASQAGAYSILATNQYTPLPLTNSQAYTVTVEPYPQFMWLAPAPITTADATLDQIGAEIGAADFSGQTVTVTLDNGSNLVFTSDNSVASTTGNGTYTGFAGTITGNANFDSVLDGGDYDGGPKTITVYNLTPGNLYAVQLFALDDRGGDADNGGISITNRQVYFQDPADTNNDSGLFTEGANDHVIGTFVANGTIQNITEQLPGNALNGGGASSGNINALVLYALPPIATAWAPLTVTPALTNAAGVTVTLNEPYATGILPIAYQWQANGVNITGATNGAYAFTASNSNDSVSLATSYALVVSNSYGMNTSADLTITITPASPPLFTTNVVQPGTLFVDDNVTLVSGVAGTPPIHLQWQLNGVNVSGANSSSLTLSALQASQGGVYTLVATNAFAAETNTPVTLTVEPFTQFAWSQPVPITTADATLGQIGTVFGAANFGVGADTVVTLSDGTNVDFTADGSVATASGGGLSNSGYFDFSPTTGNSAFDTVLSQFNYSGGPKTITINNLTPGKLYAVQLFALDDRWYYLDNAITVNVPIPERTVYFQDPNDTNNASPSHAEGANEYIVGMFMANATSQTITEQMPGNPSLGDNNANQANFNALVVYSVPNNASGWLPPVADPADTVPVGTTVTLSDPGVTGLPPFHYQWQTNGVNIGGATNSTLVLSDVLASQAGNYDVVVANSFGTNASPALALNVINEPVFTRDGAGWTLSGVAAVGSVMAGTAPTMTNGWLTLINGNNADVASCFFATPVYLGAFEASFTYQATGSAPVADGFTFCVQDSPYGPVVVGSTGSSGNIDGGMLGYGGIGNSAAISFNINSSYTVGYAYVTDGLLTDGGPIGGYTATGPVNLASGDPINITINYNGKDITLSLVDANASASFTTNIAVGPLSSVLGAETGYVGFTAGAGALTAVETVTNFSFTPLLVPVSAHLTAPKTAVIGWPAGVGGYVLQTSMNLRSWTTVPPPYAAGADGGLQVTVPASGTAFYRLQLAQ